MVMKKEKDSTIFVLRAAAIGLLYLTRRFGQLTVPRTIIPGTLRFKKVQRMIYVR